jgi:hypothetical protein
MGVFAGVDSVDAQPARIRLNETSIQTLRVATRPFILPPQKSQNNSLISLSAVNKDNHFYDIYYENSFKKALNKASHPRSGLR